MAKINVESGGASPLSTGELQLANGVAMSTTLTSVTDQNNTASQLKLASNLTQVAGTLQIQTDTATYLDIEDGSGNNRFTVSRQPASQQVSVDFASVPTDLTTVVGAIRTATNGSTLANIVSFTEAGNVGFGTDTPGTKVDVHSANNTVAQFNRTGTGNSQIQHLMTGTARWTTGYVNATGNYSVYDNVNSVFRTNLSNTGKLTIGNGDTALTGQLNVKGSGSTSATNSLLVQNSAGTEQLYVRDDNAVGSANSKLDFTNNSVGHRIGNLTITGGNIVSSGGLQFGAASGFAIFASPILSVYFQPETDILLQSFLPNNTTRNGLTFNNPWTNAGASGTSVGNIMKFNNSLGTSVGNVTINMCSVTNTVNTTAGTTLQRGFYYNPTLTGTVGFTHRAIQTTSGGAYINTATPDATACLQADSTTQGFLPPRMTNVQRAAITTPAIGLMVYCTDAVEGLYVYKSTGWTFVI